jgi:hypothetical protein
MATEKSTTFHKVDPASLPEGLKAKWAALAKASAAQKAARDEFEAAFVAASNKAKKIPDGKKVVFGYRFGGLAVAVVDKDEGDKPTKGASAWF